MAADNCRVQYQDSLSRILEQVDVLKRFINDYPDELALVLTADGNYINFNWICSENVGNVAFIYKTFKVCMVPQRNK